jgi:capsular exopolysaccharide synthesis family protein
MIVRDDRAALAPYQPMVPALSSPMYAEPPEPSVLRGIWRHFWMVILFAVIGAGGAVAFLKHATPLYTSEAQIYIQPQSNLRVLNESLGSAQRSNYLYTQASLICSTPILNIVAEMPEIKNLKTFQLTGGNPVFYMRDWLSAEVGRKDDILSVAISTPYPDESATIVNAVVAGYKQYSEADTESNATGLLKTLEDSYTTAKAEQGTMEDAVLVYEKAHPTLRLDTIFQERLRVLSANYTAAQLDTITIRTNPAIGPGHPALQAALKKEEALYGEYQQELSRAMKTNIELTDYTKLKADLDSKKQFVAALEDRIKQLRLNREAGHILNEIKVIEQARPAMRPSFPKPKRALAVAIVLGGLLGAGLALLRDRMDGRMRSVEEIQTVIGLPILGVVPGMTGRRTAVARAMTVHLDPRSVVAESYRTIRTAVYFGTTGTRCRTILVTSPESGDGKTTSASNLAIAIAQTGRSVLLLDADFRKPTQHKNLDIKNSIGLSSVLAGHDPLETAIQRTGVEGLDILPCGPIPANPSEILNSREFGELIDNLASRYDHILFDSPPVNAVTDARILGAVCDATILVLRADKSTRKAGEHARNALLAVGARVLGAIVNDAPNKKGYEVYGGSYYGSPEVAPRQSDRQGHTSTDFRRLPTPVSQNAR